MQFATIRIGDTEILALSCPRLAAQSGAKLLALVMASVKRGARNVVLDFGPDTVVDFDGAEALEAASKRVATGSLYVAGLSGSARKHLRLAQVAQHLGMVDVWTDAMEPLSLAA